MIIYAITNKVNDKMYIGQTTRSLEQRFREHCSVINLQHSIIDKAIRKYGKENFEVNVVEVAHTIEELNEREKFWIDYFKTLSPNGYNLREGGSNSILSDETKQKISRSQSGKIRSSETRKRLSQSLSGLKRSREFCEQRSKLNRLRHVSEETKSKLREANLGKRLSEETRRKLSEAAHRQHLRKRSEIK